MTAPAFEATVSATIISWATFKAMNDNAVLTGTETPVEIVRIVNDDGSINVEVRY